MHKRGDGYDRVEEARVSQKVSKKDERTDKFRKQIRE